MNVESKEYFDHEALSKCACCAWWRCLTLSARLVLSPCHRASMNWTSCVDVIEKTYLAKDKRL
jgi:hypothetical protein